MTGVRIRGRGAGTAAATYAHAVGNNTLSYDANGNMTTDDQGQHLKYDAWNRLIEVDDSSNNFLKGYVYDALGRCIREITGGTVTFFGTTRPDEHLRDLYYSAAGQVLETYTTDGLAIGAGQSPVAEARTFYSPVYVNAPIARDTTLAGTPTRVYFTSDANCNVTSVISATGTALQHQVYTAYGQITFTDAAWTPISADAFGQESLFQGMRFDKDIGWYFTPNRLYRAELGIWNRVDPIQADGMNWYVPLAANPINRTDASGLTWAIHRNHQKLAIAEPGPDDTIRTLATQLHLNPEEYHKWLTAIVLESYGPEPDDNIHAGLDDKVVTNCKYHTFMVPNAVAIDMGDSGSWKLADAVPITSIFSDFAAAGKAFKSQKETDGFFVDYVMPATSEIMTNTLRNGTKQKVLYEYYYFGHGEHGGINGGLIPQKYTEYGLAGMYLFACESLERFNGAYMQDGHLVPFISDTEWRRNVAPAGTLGGFEVTVTGGMLGHFSGVPNFGDAYITRSGL